MKSTSPRIALALALLGVAGAGCTSSSAYDSAYYDPYVYYSYYPAEVFYSSYYWADPFYFYYLDGTVTSRGAMLNGAFLPYPSRAVIADAGTLNADAGTLNVTVTSDAGTTVGTNVQSLGDALRALARGEDVCPSHVTIAQRMVPNPCPANASGMIRGGVAISFVDCQLANGATLNGDVDVQTTRMASDENCGSSTLITITHTVTATNLSYLGPSGRRLVIPNQTATGTTTYVVNQPPPSAVGTLDGRIQVFGADGALVADRSYTGDVMVTPSTDRSAYTVDGTLSLADADDSGTTTLTAVGVTRTAECCRPTGGTLSATRTGMKAFGLHVWAFNPACGEGQFDGRTITWGPCL
jgi:hypothetical protein